jgi:hypothetical protein
VTNPPNNNVRPTSPPIPLTSTAPPPNSIDPVTLLPRRPPNPKPGQVMNIEP